jgi:hypothetical protein
MPIEDTRPPDQRLRDAGVVHVLQRMWTYPVTTKSDDSRVFADEIAEASSRGFITTAVVPPNKASIYGRIWKVTPEGLAFLYAHAELLMQEEIDYVRTHVQG